MADNLTRHCFFFPHRLLKRSLRFLGNAHERLKYPNGRRNFSLYCCGTSIRCKNLFLN